MPEIIDSLTQRATQKAQAVAQNALVEITKQAQEGTDGLKLPTNGMKDGLVRSLKGAREEITGGINTKLTNPLFSTGAKDELSLIDVYGQKNNSTINTFVETLKGVLTGPLEAFREKGIGGILGNIESFSNVVAQVANGFNLNPQAMADRISGCIGQSSLFNNMSSALKTATTLGGKIPPEISNVVFTVVNEVVSSSKTNNVRDAQDLFNLVDQVTSDSRMSGLMDYGAQCSVYTGMVGQAIQLNVPGCIDALAERANNDDVVKVALQANAINAIQSGNLEVVNLFLENIGAGKIVRDIPNAAPVLAQTYVAPKVAPEDTLDAEWDNLQTALTMLDPSWDIVYRAGESVTNLEVFTKASPDAKRLMARDPGYATALLIAEKHPSVDLKKNIKKKYPLAAI